MTRPDIEYNDINILISSILHLYFEIARKHLPESDSTCTKHKHTLFVHIFGLFLGDSLFGRK